MNTSSRRVGAGLALVLGLFLLAGCSSDDDPKPSDPLPSLESSVEDRGSESLGTVFEEQGTGPTTLTVDVPDDVKFVQVGGTCSPAQVTDDPADHPFEIVWGESGYSTECDPKSPGASATIPVKNIGTDRTFEVKIAKGVAWRVAGVSVEDPDAE